MCDGSFKEVLKKDMLIGQMMLIVLRQFQSVLNLNFGKIESDGLTYQPKSEH